MSVEAVRFENFMAFRDTGWIELKPICLLFGRNSSGKSAIIRALRLLKQSLDQDNESQPLMFVTEEGVDVGDFRTVLHGQQLQRDTEPQQLVFHFRCDLVNTYDHKRIPSSTLTIDALRRRINSRLEQRRGDPISARDTPGILDLSLGFSWDDRDQHVVPVLVRIDCPWQIVRDQSLTTVFEARREPEFLDSSKEDRIADKAEADRWTWRPEWILSSDLLMEYYRTPNDADFSAAVQQVSGVLPTLTDSARVVPDDPHSESDFQLVKTILQAFRTIIRLYFESMEYLGPIRPGPQRVYMLDRHEREAWRRQGLDPFLNFLEEDIDAAIKDRIAPWLEKLRIGTGADPNKYAANELGLMASISVTEVGGAHPVGLVDYGFGASQILPVLIQCLAARPGTLVMVEQPELHLHPDAQARIADLFVEMANQGVRFLLETHSESLILRLRRRMAETTRDIRRGQRPEFKVDADMLQAYFVDRIGGVSICEPVRYDSLGRYVTQPRGFIDFFGNDFEELMALDDARLEAEEEVF